jgi:alkylated DNA repair dioxygenase AlkB
MEHRGQQLHVYHDPGFILDVENSLAEIHEHLESELFAAAPPNRRANAMYGDDGLVYRLEFGGYGGRPRSVVERPALPWREQPVIAHLRDLVSAAVDVRFNCCVVQRYPHGRVGIAPHRDKEMRGATIACLSFGATRELVLHPPRYARDAQARRFSLPAGSLYVLRPPTNDHWMHEIAKDASVRGSRVSLTFRNLPA